MRKVFRILWVYFKKMLNAKLTQESQKNIFTKNYTNSATVHENTRRRKRKYRKQLNYRSKWNNKQDEEDTKER